MNKLLLLSIITAPLYISFYNTCMIKSSQDILDPQQYQQQCFSILIKDENKIQLYKSKLINKNLSQKKLLKEKALNVHKLVEYQTNLLTQTECLFEDIKKDHRINERLWKRLIKTIINVHQLDVNNQQFALPNTYHDKTISENIYNLITGRLKFCSINPGRVTIHNIQNSSFPHIFYSKPPLPRTYKNLSLATDSLPIEIYIDSDNFSQLPSHHQVALGVRIVEEISQNAQLLPTAIASLEPILHGTKNIIPLNPNFIALKVMCQDKLTVLLPCLFTRILAPYMLQLYFDYRDQNFTLDDYALLSKINRRWNIINLIEGYLNQPSDTEPTNLSHSK